MDGRRFPIAQTNRFTAAIRKILSIKGEEHDVNFGVHLEDERPEYSFLKNEYLFSQWHQVTVGAGSVAQLGIINPASSDVLCVLTSIFAECDVVGTRIALQWGVPTQINSNGNVRMRDLRWAQGGTGVARTIIQYGSNNPGAIGGLGKWTELGVLAAGQPLDFTAAGGRVGSIVLSPGYCVYLTSTAVAAVVLTATFNGYVRSLESGELIPG